jgi:hypothetical protein
VGASGPEEILKVALNERGTAALRSSCRAVDSLSSDPRLQEWAAVLPRTLAAGWVPTGRAAVLEQRVDGKDGREIIGPAPDEVPVTAVLDVIGSLHRRTGRAVAMDTEMLHRWVDEPAAVLERWLAGTSAREAVYEVRRRLKDGLENRVMTLSWTHGDLAPGNVVFSVDGRRLIGIIDWEQAGPDGLSDLDTVHLLLTTRMLREDREMGDLVCDLVRRPESGAGLLGDPALVLLAWLGHVSAIVCKTAHYAPAGYWAARNVHPVLNQVRSTT